MEVMEIVRIVKSFFVKKQEDEKTKYYEYVLTSEFDENDYLLRAKLETYYYPIYPYGNYVKSVLIIEKRKGVIIFERYDVRMNWNGTGRDNVSHIEIQDIFEEAPEFLTRDFYEEIDSAEKFEEKLREITKFLKDYIDMLNIIPE